MSAKPGDQVTFSFNTFSPSAPYPVTNADALPTLVLFRNNVATAVPVAVLRTDVGSYAAVLTIPDSWVQGDSLKVQGSYTVQGQAESDALWRNILSAMQVQVITSRSLPNRGNPDHFGGAQVKAKRPTIQVRADFVANIQHTLLADGLPFDLEAYGLDDMLPGGVSESLSVAPSVMARITERSQAAGTVITCNVVSTDQAQVTFRIPDSIMNGGAGLWLIEFFVQTDGLQNVFISDAFLYIERSGQDCNGPPMMAEVRLFLRDYAQENELLDAVDFDGSEIALSAGLCVDEWNECPPPDGVRYNTQTFPYRRNWLIGISSYLFGIAAEHYARNQFTNQSGGLAIDDKNKAAMYSQKQQMAKEEWQTFVRERKMVDSINRGGYSTISGCLDGAW